MKNLIFVFALVFAFQNASAQATWRIVNGSSEHVQSGKSYYLQGKPTTNPILPAPILCLIFVQKYTK